jgi:glucose-1-phosphate cytidylyltransferase
MIDAGQRFGVIDIDKDNTIKSFREKSKADSSVINGGFMVFEPEVFDLIEGDSTVFEKFPLQKMAETGELKGFSHKGFWHCMDTARDKQNLENLWNSGNAPWKIW